jgi:glycolate oxidase FAD binding subunit
MSTEKLLPQSAEELAAALGRAAAMKSTIQLGGAFSKSRLGGHVAPAAVTVSTCALNHVLQYEPRDLTISVGAGMRFADLRALLAANRQMVPLDPPFSTSATIGGILAANSSGPRRRLYGSARDLVIGLQFATLEGKLIQAGGMVVKNVAGLDMAKLLIGSYGTLAAITVVNFKLIPLPACQRSFVFSFHSLHDAVAMRNRILSGILQPAAIDLLSPPAAALLDRSGWTIAIAAAGNAAMMERYTRELPDPSNLEGDAEETFWRRV